MRYPLFSSMLTLLSAFASITTNSNETPISCELMHSAHPHPTAIAPMGESRLSQAHTLNLAQTAEYSLAFIPLTREIAEAVSTTSSGGLEIVGQDLVLGGYAGQSTITVVLRVQIHDPSGTAALLRLASHIGYVYAQESTLVICEGHVIEGWSKVTSLEVSDEGREKFLTEKNATIFYGMMVSAFNGPEKVGYTYYYDSQVFSTVAEFKYGKKGNAIVEGLANWINIFSNGDVELSLKRRPVQVFYPHNSWEANPQGATYRQYMREGKLNPQLAERRVQFLQIFDDFFDHLK